MLNRLSAWLRRRSDGIVGFLTGIGVARGGWLTVGCLVAIYALFLASSWYGWPEKLGAWFKRRKAEKRERLAERIYAFWIAHYAKYEKPWGVAVTGPTDYTLYDIDPRQAAIAEARRASGLPDWEPPK